MTESLFNSLEESDNSNFILPCSICEGLFSIIYNIDNFPINFVCTDCKRSTEANDLMMNNNEKKGNKKLGRKTKRDKKDEGGHNKYTFDNLLKKTKRMIINKVFDFINKEKLSEYKDKLMLLNYEQIRNDKIEYNKAFLKKTLGEILSVELSKRTNNYNINHNKILIEKLRNEVDQEKKDYFNGLFNLTFLDCLKYFRGEEDKEDKKGTKLNYFNGMDRFNDLENDKNFVEKNGEKYINELREFILEFEKRLNVKKGRKPYKKK